VRTTKRPSGSSTTSTPTGLRLTMMLCPHWIHIC